MRAALLLLTLIMASSAVQAQHATAFDVEDGAQAFQDSCANCHGPDGNLIAGIDLGKGLYRRPYSDAELITIILTGIPETPMPPALNMNEEQAAKVVAYLRSLAEVNSDVANSNNVNGSSERGRNLFHGEGLCLECHRVNGQGSRLGPDLSQIGLIRRAAELEMSLLDPSAEVQANNRFYTVQTMKGDRVSGRLLNHDTFTVQLLDSEENLRSFSKADLEAFGFVDAQMPALSNEFDNQDLADLISYLVSLRGQ